VLAEEAKRRRRLGGALYLYRANDEVLRILRRSGGLDDIGAANIFPPRTDAVGFIYPVLDVEICRACERRIFRECKANLPDGQARSGVAATLPAAS